MSSITWTKIKGISLRRAAQENGFNLFSYHTYNEDTREEVRRKSIKGFLDELDSEYFSKTNKSLQSIDRSVYVICLSGPFAVRYPSGTSDIIYIGSGSARKRFNPLFNKSLFGFMQSLPWVDYDFYISEPRLRNAIDYYGQVEYFLLNRFKERFGGERGYDRLPLLNVTGGHDMGFVETPGWEDPISENRKNPLWILQPTEEWFKKQQAQGWPD